MSIKRQLQSDIIQNLGLRRFNGLSLQYCFRSNKLDFCLLKLFAALFVIMPAQYLYVEMRALKQKSLRCTQQGCQHKKRKKEKNSTHFTDLIFF